MQVIEYYLMPESGYEGTFESKEGEYPRLAEWNPIETDVDEYDEIVSKLTAIHIEKPYSI